MVKDKISITRSSTKGSTKYNIDKKPQNQTDDGGDEGGGGAGKKKGHSYKGEQLQKLVGKGVLKGKAFKEFLNRHEGVDLSDLKDTPLQHDAEEEAKESAKDSLHRETDNSSKQRLPAEQRSNRGFFNETVQTQTSTRYSSQQIAQELTARAIAGASGNFHGYSAQSWIGNIADTATKSAQSKRGNVVAGSVFAASAKTNHLGEAVSNVKSAPYKSFLEASATTKTEAISTNTETVSSKVSMSKKR